MNSDIYLEVLGFLDRFSLDAAKLVNADGKELIDKHFAVYPLRVLKSVAVKPETLWGLVDANVDESEYTATLTGMDDSHKRYAKYFGIFIIQPAPLMS